jgi:hypothetical protein
MIPMSGEWADHIFATKEKVEGVEYKDGNCKKCKFSWGKMFNEYQDPSYCYMFERYMPNCQQWKK